MPSGVEHIMPEKPWGHGSGFRSDDRRQRVYGKKDDRTAADSDFPYIQEQARLPMSDVETVNATRQELWRRLDRLRLPLESGTGA